MQKDAGVEFSNLKVDGGASNNNLLMQIQADLLNSKVIRPKKTTETTALGAAFFAGLATGFWKSTEDLEKLWKEDQSFEPNPDDKTESIINLWENRVSQ